MKCEKVVGPFLNFQKGKHFYFQYSRRRVIEDPTVIYVTESFAYVFL